jgi:predicted DCC family thiol-disulfide oxidoreductase YuxK
MKSIEIPIKEKKKLITLIPEGREGLLVFDGECVLCNTLTGHLLKSDKNKRLVFATFHSVIITSNLPELYLSELKSQSLIFITKKGIFLYSDAVLEIARTTGHNPILTRLAGLTPLAVRNFIYRIIARNRYRWFGKTDQCIIPSPEDVGRFLV